MQTFPGMFSAGSPPHSQAPSLFTSQVSRGGHVTPWQGSPQSHLPKMAAPPASSPGVKGPPSTRKSTQPQFPQVAPAIVPQWHVLSWELQTVLVGQEVTAQPVAGPQLLSIGEHDSPGASHTTPFGPPHLHSPP